MASAFTDDPTIPNSEELWRRIPPWHLVPDPDAGGIRISTQAFEDDAEDDHPLSVMLGSVMLAAGGWQAALAGHDDFGLVLLLTGEVRKLGQIVARDPVDGQAHALVVGKKTKGVRKALVGKAAWLIPPPGRIILGLDRIPATWTAGLTVLDAWKLLLPRLPSPPNPRP